MTKYEANDGDLRLANQEKAMFSSGKLLRCARLVLLFCFNFVLIQAFGGRLSAVVSQSGTTRTSCHNFDFKGDQQTWFSFIHANQTGKEVPGETSGSWVEVVEEDDDLSLKKSADCTTYAAAEAEGHEWVRFGVGFHHIGWTSVACVDLPFAGKAYLRFGMLRI